MSSKFDSYQKRRLRSSYFSVVVSIALVLFMVGVLGLILLKSTKVANRVKEKIAITLFIKDNVTQKQIKSFKEFIEKSWKLPEEYYGNRYSVMVHGIGLCDEWPSIRYPTDGGERSGFFEKTGNLFFKFSIIF